MSHKEKLCSDIDEQSQKLINLHDDDLIKSMDYYSLAEIVDTKKQVARTISEENDEKLNDGDIDDEENKLMEQYTMIEERVNDLFFLKVKEMSISDGI